MHAIRDVLAAGIHVTGVVFALLLGGVVALQHAMETRANGFASVTEELSRVPEARYLKPVLLGYDAVASDVLWLRAVQVLGQKQVSYDDFEWLYHVLDVMTSLDPHYTEAYRAGGVILTELAHRPDLSNRLLEKGLAQSPDAWWLPFNLAYNHFFYLDNHERGAAYMAQASRLQGSPAYLPRLAARMYAESGNPEVGISFLQAMILQAGDASVKQALQRRLADLMLERDVTVLDAGVATYHARFGRFPPRLDVLVAAGLLEAMPQAPAGSEFLMDHKTGRVSVSTRPARMLVYRP